MLAGLVDHPIVLPEHQELSQNPRDLNYPNKSLSLIVSQLKSAYEVEIILENKNLGNCRVTVDVPALKELFGQLDILCANIGAH